MSGGGSAFEFKMTHVQLPHEHGFERLYTDLLDKRCQSVIKLRIEKLSSLEDGPSFTIALSHALDSEYVIYAIWIMTFLIAIHIRH